MLRAPVQAERARKNAEAALNEATSRINELTVNITSITGDRRRFEADLASLQAELDEAHRGRREAEDRADRLQIEVASALPCRYTVYISCTIAAMLSVVSRSSSFVFCSILLYFRYLGDLC